MIKLISIKPSTNKEKKLMAQFMVDEKKRTIHFGAKGYFDYTLYYKQNKELAEKKKKAYIARHEKNEDFSDPLSAGSLARWILWNKETVESSINDFKKKFKLN
jgi:hypothetical protein